MQWRLGFYILAGIAITACGTTYKEPGSSVPRAKIAGKQKDCIIGCKGGVFIQAINGVQVSNMWKSNNYYLFPGPNSVLVAVLDAGLAGACDLRFDAVADKEYLAVHAIDGANFVVTVKSTSEEVVTTCTSGMRPAPVNNYTPVFIPVG